MPRSSALVSAPSHLSPERPRDHIGAMPCRMERTRPMGGSTEPLGGSGHLLSRTASHTLSVTSRFLISNSFREVHHMRRATRRSVSCQSRREAEKTLRRACRDISPTPGLAGAPEPLENRIMLTIVQPAGQNYLAFEAEDPQATIVDLDG